MDPPPFEEQGHPVDDDKTGDCRGRQCDGKGGIEVVNLDNDIPPPDEECFVYKCSSGTPMEVAVGADTACTKGVCDGMGACVACLKDADCDTSKGEYCVNKSCASCSDSMQSGDETGVDCGGTHCNGKKCNGDACQNAGECKSGVCADGVCCNSACTEPCKSCKLMGSPAGTCTSIPEFEGDPSYTNPVSGQMDVCDTAKGQACSSSGACLLLAGGKCKKDADCLGNKCNGTICLGKTGEPCGASNTICASGQCDGGTCT
jgi:hypothetical protein